MNGNNGSASEDSTCFDFLKEINKLIGHKNITNIYRIEVYNSIMCDYFCITFMLKGKGFLDYTSYTFEKTLVLSIII